MTPGEVIVWAQLGAWVVAAIPWMLIARRERKKNRSRDDA